MRILKLQDGNHYHCIVKKLLPALLTNMYRSIIPNLIVVRQLTPNELKKINT